jgi:hypothetical protein
MRFLSRATTLDRLSYKCNYDNGPPPDVIRIVSSTIKLFISTGLIESAPTHMLSNIENRRKSEEKKSAESPGRKYDIPSILNPDGKPLAPFRKYVI